MEVHEATSILPSPNPAIGDEFRNDLLLFAVGQLVHVERRAWPGINQPGGVGRIGEVSVSSPSPSPQEQPTRSRRVLVSVRYVLDGRYEKSIDTKYVRIHNQSAGRDLRDRGMLLGRCQRCGSLRRDCGSCDVWTQLPSSMNQSETTTKVVGSKKKKAPPHSKAKDTTEDDDDDDDTDSIDAMLEEIKAFNPMGRKLKTLQKKAKLLLFGQNDDDDNDDFMQTASRRRGEKPQQRATDWTLDPIGSENGLDSDSDRDEGHHRHDVHQGDSISPDSASDDDSCLLQELLASQKPSSVPQTGGVMANIKARRKAKDHRHKPSILERIGAPTEVGLQSNAIKQPNKPAIESHRTHGHNNDNTDNSFKTWTPLRPSSTSHPTIATPSSALSFASRDTKESEENDSSQKQHRERDFTPPTDQVQRMSMNYRKTDILDATQQDDDLTIVCDQQFIQPEGNAEEMPSDIVDQTKNLPFRELPAFFDRLVHGLETDLIPKARQQLAEMEAQLNNSSKTERIIPYEQEVSEHLKMANETYQHLLVVLVQQGRDQCQNALRKATNRRRYRKNKGSMTARQLEEFRGAKLEAREMRYDQLNDNLEEILAECRHCIQNLEDEMEQQQQHRTDEEKEEDDDDDRWVDPPAAGEDDLGGVGEITTTAQQQSLDDSMTRPLSPFDPHQHARVKKRHKQSTATFSHKTRAANTNKHKLSKGTQKRETSSGLQPGDKIVVLRNRLGTAQRDGLDEDGNSDCAISIDKQADPNSFANSEEQEDQTGGHTLIIHGGTSTTPTINQSAAQERGNSSSVQTGRSLDVQDPNGSGSRISRIDERQRSGSGDIERAVQRPQRQERHRDSSAVSTMEKFLKANAEHVPPPARDKENNDMEPRHNGHKTNARKRSGQEMTLSNDSASEEVNRVQMVFSALRKRSKTEHGLDPRPTIQPTQATQSIVQSICDTISKDYPNSTCCKSLAQLTDLLHFGSLEQDAVSCIRLAFMVAFRSQRGKRILQELISTNSPELDGHVSLLVAATALLSFIRDKQLSTQGADDIFSAPYSGLFLDAVICQFVEAVFSTYLPSAWALGSSTGLAHTRDHLERLLSSLSLHVNMVERTSRCLLQELRTQQWRVGFNQDCVFLSCFDPERWSSLLDCSKSTQLPRKTTSSRYSVLGNNLPRCEVDAIWCTLAFVASSDRKVSENGKLTWDLLSDILLRGTLSVSPSQTLSPSPAHLQECLKEMRHLTDLVSSGALESVALKDSFLTNVVKRASLVSNALVQPCFRMVATATREDDHMFKILASRIKSQLVLNGTAMSNGPEAQQQRVDLSDILSNPDKLAAEERLLLPSSALTRQCMALLCAWIARLPPKRVRINSFVRKTKISWVQEMKAWVSGNRILTNEMDPFQQAFSCPSQNDPKATNQAYFMEFAAFCEVCSWVAMGIRTDIPGTVPKIRAIEMVQRIWTLLSNDEMDQRLKMVSQRIESRGAYQGDFYLVQVTAKVLTCLGLSIVGLNPFVQENHIGAAVSSVSLANEDEGTLDFVASALLTCLDCSRHSQEQLEPFCFVSGCLGRLVSSLRRLRNSSSAESWQVSAASALLGSCWDKFLPVFRGYFGMNHYQKVSGPLGEHALSLIVSALYGLVPTDQPTTTRITRIATPALIEAPADKPAQNGIDEFGGVDDAALVALLNSCESKKPDRDLFTGIYFCLQNSCWTHSMKRSRRRGLTSTSIKV